MSEINKKQAVYIIDGSSFLYRAFYSIRELTTKSGTPVNAVYGFCRMIKKLIEEHQPSHLVLVWDSPGKTVRHELYDGYKSTRQAAPNALFEQKSLIKQFADMINLVQVENPGIEADDLMYSLAQELSLSNQKSVIVTSDKDLLQTVSANITVYDPFKEAFLTPEVIIQKYGFEISKFPFYFALIGDSSDNIPGAKGIGPKTATELVNQFVSLEDMYENLEQIKSERVQKLLQDSKANVFLSEQLFKLRAYSTYLTFDCCSFVAQDWQVKAAPFFELLEFKSLLKDLKLDGKKIKKESTLSQRYKFVLVNQIDELNYVIEQIQKYKKFGIDTEGTSLSPIDGQLVGISVCCKEGESFYIPFGHITEDPQLPKAYVIEQLRPYFEDENIEKYMHNAKFDLLMLNTESIDVKNVKFDTMIAASLIVSEGQRLGLKALSDFYFEEPMIAFSDVVQKNKYKNFAYVPLGMATEYAAADAHQTLKLKTQLEKLLQEHKLLELFYNLEMPLMLELYKMEKRGIYVNKAILDEINQTVSGEINVLRHQIIDYLGQQFMDINLNSSKQLEDLLFNYLQLPALKKTTKKTAYSTDQEVLQKLSQLHPIPGLILRYRELFKLKSTYLEGLPNYISKKTGRIHTSFNQVVVSTGRLASSDPNLQNIPVDKYSIRRAFQASPGYTFFSADYSQIELRVLTFLSQDATLLNAFKNDMDIHNLTAAGLFDVDPSQVTHDQRQVGKRINFSIMYGLTPHGLSKSLNISHNLAKKYIDKYMEKYPGVSLWMEEIIKKAEIDCYVETRWGRRRYIPGIKERNRSLYELACRLVVNTAGQGTAAELVKLGMIKLDRTLKDKNFDVHLLLQIHDELLFEVKDEHLEQFQIFAKDILENIVDWNVPLKVSTRTGKDWQEVTKS